VKKLLNGLKRAIGKKLMAKLRMTIAFQIEYEADPECYDTKDLKEMAAIDESAANHNPLHALRALALSSKDGKWRVKCELVPEKESS